MECNKISGLLIDFIDNQLDKTTKEMVENHLKDCQSCNNEYRQTTELFVIIKRTPEKQPDAKLKLSFDKMLADEKTKLLISKHDIKVSFLSRYRYVMQIAAAIFLLFTGYLFGYNSKSPADNNEKLTSMQHDVSEMKEMMALSLLKDESASQRIKAVNYTEEMQTPDNQIIEALINTLDNDKNSNVRLAAIYSLARFKNNKLVRNALIKTLNKQDDPMVQIVIINLLVEMEEAKAVDELKKLLKNKDLNEEVKSQAELGVKVLS